MIALRELAAREASSTRERRGVTFLPSHSLDSLELEHFL